MRTSTDALLSVRRMVTSVLPGPPWRVLLAGDEGRTMRPYAIVSSADGATGRVDGPGTHLMTMPMVVHAFPPVGTRSSGSKLIAERVADALDLAVRVGVPDYKVPAVRGGRQRIPLWDYGGGATLDLAGLTDETALTTATTARKAADYLLVSDGWTAKAMPQADVGDLFVAVLEMRVRWYAPSTRPATGPPLEAVNPGVGP